VVLKRTKIFHGVTTFPAFERHLLPLQQCFPSPSLEGCAKELGSSVVKQGDELVGMREPDSVFRAVQDEAMAVHPKRNPV